MGVVLEALDAAAVRRWGRTAAESLDLHRAEIDGLNVFPVPDGDTGTNLALTLAAADAALTDAVTASPGLDAGGALRALARGAVLGARGNSGVIVAQLLRGLADVADGALVVDAAVLAKGLRRGAEQARAAVADPVEGTVLTVAAAAADAAAAVSPTGSGSGLGALTRAALEAADEALRHTPEQLPVLARAGVVDAGGRGWVVVLDALVRTVTGAAAEVAAPRLAPRLTARPAHLLEGDRESGSGEFAYEVQYLLHADETAVEVLRGELAGLGDSVAVVGTGDDVWNVHVHVNDVGAAIEAGVVAGRPYRITVVRFADRPASDAGEAARSAPAAAQSAASAVVAVAPGEGLAHLFEAEGVEVVDGGPGRSPSTADVVAAVRAAVRATGAEQVVLLPNASQVTGVAEAAAEEARAEGVRVMVVPTRSPVQGLAAVAVHDPGRRFDDDVVAMAEAAAATRFAEVTVARREALTSVGICQAGDVLGLIDGEVVEIGRGLVAVALALTDRLLGVGAELMTVLVGADAPPAIGDLLRSHVQERSPLTDVCVYAGGQPHYPLIVGIE